MPCAQTFSAIVRTKTVLRIHHQTTTRRKVTSKTLLREGNTQIWRTQSALACICVLLFPSHLKPKTQWTVAESQITYKYLWKDMYNFFVEHAGKIHIWCVGGRVVFGRQCIDCTCACRLHRHKSASTWKKKPFAFYFRKTSAQIFGMKCKARETTFFSLLCARTHWNLTDLIVRGFDIRHQRVCVGKKGQNPSHV